MTRDQPTSGEPVSADTGISRARERGAASLRLELDAETHSHVIRVTGGTAIPAGIRAVDKDGRTLAVYTAVARQSRTPVLEIDGSGHEAIHDEDIVIT